MCRSVCCVLGFLVLSPLALLTPAALADDANTDIAQFEALAAYFESWRDEAIFDASFIYQEWDAGAYEDAIKEDRVQNTPLGAAGRLLKRGNHVRLLFTTDAHGWKAPIDEVTDQRIQVRHMILHDNSGHSIYVTRRDAELEGTSAPGIMAQGIVSPLSPFGDYRFPIIEFNKAKLDGPREITWVANGDNRKEVHVDVRISDEQCRKTVIIGDHLGVPVIEELRLEIRKPSPEGDILMRRIARMSDYQTCGQYAYPRKVFRVVELTADQSRCTLWESPDLGDSDPQDTDFIIDVPPGVTLAGFRAPPQLGSPRRINVFEVRDEDLGDGVFQAPVDRTSPMSRNALWILGLLACIGCTAVVTLARKRLRRGK